MSWFPTNHLHKAENKNHPDRGGLLFFEGQDLCSALGQRADSSGRETELHPANPFGLEVNRKRATSVTFGVANFVTGLSTPARELTDAAHSSVLKAITKNKP